MRNRRGHRHGTITARQGIWSDWEPWRVATDPVENAPLVCKRSEQSDFQNEGTSDCIQADTKSRCVLIQRLGRASDRQRRMFFNSLKKPVGTRIGLQRRATSATLPGMAPWSIPDPRQRRTPQNGAPPRKPTADPQVPRHGPALKKHAPAAFPYMNTASHHRKLAEATAPDNAHYPEVRPSQ